MHLQLNVREEFVGFSDLTRCDKADFKWHQRIMQLPISQLYRCGVFNCCMRAIFGVNLEPTIKRFE